MKPHFTHLVLSGGGLAAFCYLGALRFLELEGLAQSIQHISGSSMGALIATAIALRIPLTTLEERVIAIMNDDKTNCIRYPDITRCISELGMDDGKRFFEVLRPEIDHETFLTLSKKTGMHLIICATHACSMEATYFSVDTTPTVLVYDAVRASAALPWIFTPVKIGNEYYIDGGVADNVPFEPFHQVSPTSILIMETHPQYASLKEEEPHHVPMQYTIAFLSRYMSNIGVSRFLREKFPNYVRFDNCPLPLLKYRLEDDVIRILLGKRDMDDSITYGVEKMHEMYAHQLEKEVVGTPPPPQAPV